MKRNLKRLWLGLLICALMVAGLSASIELTSAASYSAYVMGYFKESPDGSDTNNGLHLAVSTDGLNWVPLNQNNPVVTPDLGTKKLRDPHIYRKLDGTFVIVGTDNWNSEYIHIWDSTDLTTFSERLVHMNSSGMHTWAPETFYDQSRGQYAIIWSGNTDRNRIYVSYTTDFVNVTSPQVFFDPGFDVIDGHMEVGVNGYNYMYYKNETDKKIYGTRSTTLDPRSFDSNTYTSGYGPPVSGSHIEAPILMKSLASNTWWLWGDSYYPVNAVFYAWQTGDLSTGSWTMMNKRDYTAPLNCKHATITPITATEYNNLIAKWGLPSWNIIKSYNFPGYYVRHQDYVGRIDPYPFDPVTDMKWKIVPGLVDSSGVSFEAVALPGYYLRNSNYSIVLNANDNSAAFKADATFYKVNGLADSSWTSFRSYVDSTRYIRHSNYVLRLDPISTDTEKQDATFKIVYGDSIRRIESYNFPGRFLRHTSFVFKLDTNISPIADSQFKVVAGLADGAGVSFESVNYPGYYLRHSGYQLYLRKNDGSSTFKGDATFYRTAGLKDANGVSYRSYNFPDRYIRHSNYYLYIQPISTDSDKSDATFYER